MLVVRNWQHVNNHPYCLSSNNASLSRCGGIFCIIFVSGRWGIGPDVHTPVPDLLHLGPQYLPEQSDPFVRRVGFRTPKTRCQILSVLLTRCVTVSLGRSFWLWKNPLNNGLNTSLFGHVKGVSWLQASTHQSSELGLLLYFCVAIPSWWLLSQGSSPRPGWLLGLRLEQQKRQTRPPAGRPGFFPTTQHLCLPCRDLDVTWQVGRAVFPADSKKRSVLLPRTGESMDAR